MNKLIMVFLLSLHSYFLFAQNSSDEEQDNTYELTGLGNTFVAIVNIGEKLYTDKCSCAIPSIGKCHLYKINIEKVIKVFDNNVFNAQALKQVKRLVVSIDVPVERGKSYVTTLQPGTCNDYIVLSKILNIDPNKNYVFKHKDGYLTDYVNCYKIGIFNRLLLALNLKEAEEIDYSNKKKKRDPFKEFINK